MVTKEHDCYERQHRECADQDSRFSGDDDQLEPERARAPGIERKPPLDAVRQVAAVTELLSQIVNRHDVNAKRSSLFVLRCSFFALRSANTNNEELRTDNVRNLKGLGTF